MKIILDTNALHNDYYLKSEQLLGLVDRVNQSKGTMQIVVPQVVVEEMIRQFAEGIKKLAASLSDNKKKMKALEIDTGGIPLLDVERLCEDYPTKLRERIQELSIQIASIPSIEHEVIIRRIHQGKRPFRDGDTREIGYRDFLIWETVKSLSQHDNRVVFISGNHKDFGEGKPENGLYSLHSDFQEDLDSQTFAEKKIMVYVNIATFLVGEGSDVKLDQEANVYKMIVKGFSGTKVLEAEQEQILVEALAFLPEILGTSNVSDLHLKIVRWMEQAKIVSILEFDEENRTVVFSEIFLSDVEFIAPIDLAGKLYDLYRDNKILDMRGPLSDPNSDQVPREGYYRLRLALKGLFYANYDVHEGTPHYLGAASMELYTF